MPYDFPNAPVVGQQVTASNNIVYVWDGLKWVAPPGRGGGGGFSAAYLPLSGGTVTGPVNTTSTQAGVAPTGSVTRSEQDRWGEVVNVKDFGAVLDGLTNENTAFTNAFNATLPRGTIVVPPARWNATSWNQPNNQAVLWKLSGNQFGPNDGAHTTEVTSVGNGVVETVLKNYTKYFGRGSTVNTNTATQITSVGPVLRVDATVNHAGGDTGGLPTFQANTTVADRTSGSVGQARPTQSVIGMNSQMTVSSTYRGYPSNVVAMQGSAVRTVGATNAEIFGANIIADDQTAPDVAVSVASGTYDTTTGNIVLTTSAPHGWVVGQAFALAITAGTGGYGSLVGYYAATSGTTGSTITCTGNSGLGTVTITAGTVSPPGTAWSGSVVSCEFNVKANGPDDGTDADGWNIGSPGANGAQRVGVDIKILRSARASGTWSGAPMAVTRMLNLALSDGGDMANCSAKNGIFFNVPITFAGINFLHSTFSPGAQAIALQNEQTIGWTTASSGTVPTSWNYLQYTTSGGNRLRYVVGTNERWSISDAGQVTFSALPASASYANDAAASAGGVPVGGIYRNGSQVMVRVS